MSDAVAPDQDDAPLRPEDLAALVGPVELADWIDAESVPTLRQYQDELAALAAGGVGDAEPVTDRLLDVIGALQQAGDTLRDDDALPSAMTAALARCVADVRGARSLVEQTRARLAAETPPAPVSEAARERVRRARAQNAA